MGGRHGSQVIYLVSNLSRGELRRIGQHRLNNRSVPPGTDPHHPTIAADCNMVIHTVDYKKKDPSAALACHLEEWADLGFVVVNFEMGGSFINDLESKDVPSVLELLASFVNCNPSKTRHTGWERERSMFKAIPSMFIDCALKCCRGQGY